MWRDTNPVWSPDGRKIAFVSNRANPGSRLRNIYVMNSDGSGVRRLTKGADAEFPRWSPDGKNIAYVANLLVVAGANASIDVMRADGSRQISVAFSGSTNDLEWSPDGRWLAFQVRNSMQDTPRLDIVRPDGTGGRQLTRYAEAFAWSPDSTRLAFSRSSFGGGAMISVVPLASGMVSPFAATSSEVAAAIAWSPDGSQIGFVGGFITSCGCSSLLSDASVYVVGARGPMYMHQESELTHIGSTNVDSTSLAWLPSRAHALVYSGNSGVHTVTLAGHDRLIDAGGCCAAPSPDGKKLLVAEHASSGTRTAIVVVTLHGHSFHQLTQQAH
jgi:Tol biopolymer transport system component